MLVQDWLFSRFLDRLLARPRGRAVMLSFMADAEESDEAGVFDELVARVDDRELEKLVRRHRDDEQRHADLLRGRLAALGLSPVPMPAHLRIVGRIDRMLGGLGTDFVEKKRGVMEAYVLLQVVEERAVEQFPKIARAFAKIDPETAAVVTSITRDEARHVRYAKAISRRYAPDAPTLERTLAAYRAVEARAYEQHGNAFTAYALDAGLLATGRAERLFWRGMVAVGDAADRRSPSPSAHAVT